MNAVISFEFDTLPVRAFNIDGEPWFVLADVCGVLEIGNSRQAATRLDDDEKGVISSDTLGGDQEMTIINESGLYSLILTSRKPQAKRFKKWVTADVLPTIRKTGGYNAAPSGPGNHVLVSNDIISRHIQLLEETIDGLRKERWHTRREEFIKVARVLFERTSLSDAEIADALGDFLGRDMPEWVAFQRRRFEEETAARH